MPSPNRLSPVQWLICIIAAIGFAFDIYELLMLPLIVRPALMELVGAAPGTELYARWFGLLFYVPAVAGGIFGLLGGYLTDRLGRRRVLTWSILVYAISAFLAGFSTSLPMLLVLRTTTFIGVCVEFVAAIAWLAELFPDARQRERVLGYTQAFSSVGGLLVAFANSLAIAFADRLPAIAMPEFLAGFLGTIAPAHQHEPWRYTLMSGLIPAVPLIVIRPFLPESPVWQQKKAAGTLRRPKVGELFAPALRKTTIVTTLMVACSFGAAFGAIQQVPQIVPGLPEVRSAVARRLEADDAKQAIELRLAASDVQAKWQGKSSEEQKRIVVQERAIAARRFAGPIEQRTAADVTKIQEVGGLVGRFVLAVLAVRIVSRRALLRVFQIPGLLLMPLVFAVAGVQNLTWLSVGIFLAGLVTVAQYSFWGNYLPLVYPVHLRGTGESFAMNIGGRMIGTAFAWVTSTLALRDWIPGESHPTKVAYTAAAVALGVYLAGSLACFWLPESAGKNVEE
jgi:MFS family permease